MEGNYPFWPCRDRWYDGASVPAFPLVPVRKNRGGIMTIALAVIVDETIILAADSKVTQKGFISSACKISLRSDVPLAYVFAGDLGVGRELRNWLTSYKIHEQLTWSIFRDDATSQLAYLNKRHRDWMRQADAIPTEEDRTSALIVGYINGQPEILQIVGTGESYFHLEDQFSAIGSGEVHARIIKATLDKLGIKWKDKYSWIWFVLETASNVDPDSGGPFRRIIVTSQGATWYEEKQQTVNKSASIPWYHRLSVLCLDIVTLPAHKGTYL